MLEAVDRRQAALSKAVTDGAKLPVGNRSGLCRNRPRSKIWDTAQAVMLIGAHPAVGAPVLKRA